MQKSKGINITVVLIINILMSFLVTWAYGYSFIVYSILSVATVLLCYPLFFIRYKYLDVRIKIIAQLLIIISFITGVLFRHDIEGFIFVNLSVIYPLIISTFEINYKSPGKSFAFAFILSYILVFLQLNNSLMGHINSNTMSFLAFSGLALSFLWFEYSKYKILCVVAVVLTEISLLQTGSRNAAIVTLLCCVLLLVPRYVFKRKIVYRCIYGITLLYTVFAARIMHWGFNNSTVSYWLHRYVDSFNKKMWTMESREDFLVLVSQKIQNMGWLTRLFGEGGCNHLGHNVFYQSIFAWGYVGTILIYLLLIIVFEMAYKKIVNGNRIVYGLVIILLGHLMINGSDVYLFGSNTLSYLSSMIIGLIIQQSAEKRELTE